jgi:hypothetical protein
VVREDAAELPDNRLFGFHAIVALVAGLFSFKRGEPRKFRDIVSMSALSERLAVWQARTLVPNNISPLKFHPRATAWMRSASAF